MDLVCDFTLEQFRTRQNREDSQISRFLIQHACWREGASMHGEALFGRPALAGGKRNQVRREQPLHRRAVRPCAVDGHQVVEAAA